jgi:hypothetical protein
MMPKPESLFTPGHQAYDRRWVTIRRMSRVQTGFSLRIVAQVARLIPPCRALRGIRR